MPAPFFVGGNIGADTSAAGFTMASPTGNLTPSAGDIWFCVLNVRNGEGQPSISGWTFVDKSPVTSDSVSATGISQIYLYRFLQTGSAPSLAITRGSGTPNLMNWGLHVIRPAAGYEWDLSNFTYSVKTEASAVTAHTHPALTAPAADGVVGHYVGFAGNGGGSLLDAATDPSTDSGAISTPNTTDFTAGKWDRRGNQGNSSLLQGGLHLGLGLRSGGAGTTGTLSATMTLSRRHASIAYVLSQILSNVAVVPNTIAAGAPVVGNPTLSAVHAVSPTGVTAAPVVGTPTLTQNHALAPSGITSTPVVGTPTLSQNHVLAPTGTAAGSPTVGTPTLAQNHVLAPTGVATGAPTVGTPTLSVNRVCTPTGIAAGAPTVGTPTLAQNHALGPTGVTASPVVGTPTLSQNHVLSPTGIATGAPTVGQPVVSTGTASIQFVGSSSGFGSPAGVSYPAGTQEGDGVLLYLFNRASTAVPTTPSGFNLISLSASSQTARGASFIRRVGASDTAIGAGALSNVTSWEMMVYRNLDVDQPIGNFALAGAGSANVSIPTFVLWDTSGRSWVAGVVGHRAADGGIPAVSGMTSRVNVADADEKIGGMDTNAGVSTWAGGFINTAGTSSGYHSQSIELKAVSSPTMVQPAGIAAGSPTVGNPALSQSHALTPTGVAAGAPTVGNPVLSHNYVLSPTGVAPTAPTVGNPVLTELGTFAPVGVAAGAPVVGAPAVSQNHALLPVGIASGAPMIGFPMLNPPIDPGGGDGYLRHVGFHRNLGTLLVR